MKIISRKQAKALGLTRYFTGKACRHGHVAERYARNGECAECALHRVLTWQADNPEYVKKVDRLRYRKNPEKKKAFSAEYRKKNPDKARAATRIASRAWRKNNPEKAKEVASAYRVANPEKASVRRAARRGARRPFDTEFLQLIEREAFDLAKRRECATGVKWHVDHVVPLQSKIVCGLHNEFNLAVITARENTSKGNRRWPDMPGEM